MIEFKNVDKGMLTKIVTKKFPLITFTELKVLFRKKDIKVDGKRINKDILLEGNEEIVIFNKDKNIKILYEDKNIIIVHKPVGIETTTVDKTYLGQSLEEYFKAYACHRLDMNTEGIVILAKNEFIQKEMFKEFKLGNIHKFYLAMVYGILEKKEDLLSDYLVKLDGYVKVLKEKEKGAVQILTKYKVVKEFENFSLIEIELLTGKTHQIRAHFAFINHFVIGDNKYGNKEINKEMGYKKQNLCAYKLKFSISNPVLSYLNGVDIETEPNFIKDYK